MVGGAASAFRRPNNDAHGHKEMSWRHRAVHWRRSGESLHGCRVVHSHMQLYASPRFLPVITVPYCELAASFILVVSGLWQGGSWLYTGTRHRLLRLPGGRPPRLQYGDKGVKLGLESGQRLGVVVVAINFTVPATPGGRHNTHTNRVKHLAAGEVRRTNITSCTAVSSAQHHSSGERPQSPPAAQSHPAADTYAHCVMQHP